VSSTTYLRCVTEGVLYLCMVVKRRHEIETARKQENTGTVAESGLITVMPV
jgi:hypothetical protein